MKKKTIQATLEIVSGRDNYDVCESIEQVLMGSSLNNSETRLEIKEIKVVNETDSIKEEKVIPNS